MIEMTMVVVIIGVVMAVALPRFGNSLGTQRADAAARAVAADVQRAVNLARSSSAPVNIVFDTTMNTYRIPGMTLTDQGNGRDLRNIKDEFPGVTIELCDFDGTPTLTIDGYGTPRTAGTIVLKKNDEIRTLVFEKASGHVDIVRGIPSMVATADETGDDGGNSGDSGGSNNANGGNSGGNSESNQGLVSRLLNLLGL